MTHTPHPTPSTRSTRTPAPSDAHPRGPRPQRTRRLARLGAGALAAVLVVPCASMVTVHAAEPDQVQVADDQAVVRAALFDRMATESATIARPGRLADETGRSSRTVQIDRVGECAEDTASDTVGDAFALDISAYGVSSNCDLWAFAAITVDTWELWELEGLVVFIDLDERASTGCDGADVAAVAIEDGGLVAGMLATPTCDDDTWTYLGDIPVDSRYTNSIALGFPTAAIGNDTSFQWVMVLQSIYGGADRAPDTGWRRMGVDAAPAPASAPRAVSARASSRTITATWRAPQSDGGSPITGHAVQIRSGRSGWTTVPGATSARRTAVVTGLVNGRTYALRVAAVTAAGRGAWSAAIEATPAGVPGTPRALDARARTRGALLTWKRPADDGGRPITDYSVQVSADRGRIWRAVADGRSTDTSARLDGLRPGRRHLVRVAARSATGRGPWSTPVAVTPRSR